EFRIAQWVGAGNYGVAGLLFPSRNCGLCVQCLTRKRYLGYRHETRDLLRSVRSEIIRKRIGVDCQKAVANWSDALGSRWHFVCQISQTLADIWLDGRHINKSFDVGMHSRLGDDHPAIAVADQYTRTCPIENSTRRSPLCPPTRLRLLHDVNRVTVSLENVRHRLPSGTIGEGAVDQNNSLDFRVRRG